MLRTLHDKPVRSGLSDYLRSHTHRGGIIACKEQKFLYMKAGKTAGTSIYRKDLERRIPGIVSGQRDSLQRQIDQWLATVTDEELEDYFIFTVVRNPWDRLVSVASYLKIPFRELVHNYWKYWEDEEVRTHVLPCHHYSHHDGVRFADMICRFECIQADFNLICDHLGIERRKLVHSNKSSHVHYSQFYGDEEREIVADLYAKDIEYFGYMFEQAEPERRDDVGVHEFQNGLVSLPKRAYRKLRRVIG